jgi:hypothetical protein
MVIPDGVLFADGVGARVKEVCFAKTSLIHEINDLATIHFQVTKV